MTRDLTTLRDWARKMADGEEVRVQHSVIEMNNVGYLSKSHTDVSALSERALWRQIANEIDTFLTRDEGTADTCIPGQTEMFGEIA